MMARTCNSIKYSNHSPHSDFPDQRIRISYPPSRFHNRRQTTMHQGRLSWPYFRAIGKKFAPFKGCFDVDCCEFW